MACNTYDAHGLCASCWLWQVNDQFEVNGKKVNIPSYLVKAGDVISVREIKNDNKTIKVNSEANSVRPVPAWIEKDNEKLSGKIIRLAAREEIDIPIEEHLIVELYSK